MVVRMSDDVVPRMQRLQEDHGPAGWPAVHISDITALLAEIERLSATVRHLNGQVDHLGIRLGEVIRERDALLAELTDRQAAPVRSPYLDQEHQP
jgi:hypothetical protein